MDGRPNAGFCGSVLGTGAYQEALYALKPVLEKSNCHTLDRHDFRAHKDSCGIGFTGTWKDAVEQRYRVNHWQYVNADLPVRECMEDSLTDSLKNLSLMSSVSGISALSTLVGFSSLWAIDRKSVV